MSEKVINVSILMNSISWKEIRDNTLLIVSKVHLLKSIRDQKNINNKK